MHLTGGVDRCSQDELLLHPGTGTPDPDDSIQAGCGHACPIRGPNHPAKPLLSLLRRTWRRMGKCTSAEEGAILGLHHLEVALPVHHSKLLTPWSPRCSTPNPKSGLKGTHQLPGAGIPELDLTTKGERGSPRL